MIEEEQSPTSSLERPETILLVDDDPTNLKVLRGALDGHGFKLLVARSGEEAMEIARRARPELILLDVMMPPGIDGHETCRRLKQDPETRESVVIFLSSLEETESKVKGLGLGAVDYITKPFQIEEVTARVDTHLTIHRLKESLAQKNRELQDANEHMRSELEAAAAYVQSILPRPIDSGDRGICVDWKFIASSELAGDSFGYHWLDDRDFAIYLLDVSGHGVGPAMLSVSAHNALRQHTLPATDFRRPHQVLEALNRAFPMQDNQNKFFTIWYGVYNKSTRQLSYACARQSLISDRLLGMHGTSVRSSRLGHI